MTGPTIGQRWQRKPRARHDGPSIVTVRQVHRPDRLAELRGPDGARVPAMTFRDLRRFYRPA